MKRYGEKATREALVNGAKIRVKDWYIGGGNRVMIDGEEAGYIVDDLLWKLIQDGTIAKAHQDYAWKDYEMSAPAAQEEPAAQENNETEEEISMTRETAPAAAQAAPAPRYDYLVTIQERYSAEIRTIKVNALNEEHARIKARAQCDYSEFIAAVEAEPVGQEKTDRENREHCRRIAEDVNDYAEGRVHRCPDCGETLTLPDDVGDKYRCPDCGQVNDVNDLEQLGLCDYFEDCLDIEYRVSGRFHDSYRSVCVMVTCGGPNIYIDTATKSVELYWWGDRASYPIHYEAADQIDEWAAEMWVCQ